MLSTVRGVGNDVGHTHGRTCKVKNLTPAKATLGTLHYIVWQHYDNFVFLRGFLWRFKKVFYTEPLLAFLRSSNMWMLRHRGSTHTHTHVDWPLHTASIPVKVAWSYLAWLSRRMVNGGDLLTVSLTVFECGWRVHRTLSSDFLPHPHQNSVSSRSPRNMSDRNMN